MKLFAETVGKQDLEEQSQGVVKELRETKTEVTIDTGPSTFSKTNIDTGANGTNCHAPASRAAILRLLTSASWA